jgi:hypothetical protein
MPAKPSPPVARPLAALVRLLRSLCAQERAANAQPCAQQIELEISEEIEEIEEIE